MMAGITFLTVADVRCVLYWAVYVLYWLPEVSMTKHSRVHCVPGSQCSCTAVRFYPEYKAVVENTVDCSSRQLAKVPDLHHFVGYKLSSLDLHNNNLTGWILRQQGLVFGDITIGNHDPYTTTQTGPPKLDLSDNPLGLMHGDEFKGIIILDIVNLKLQNCALQRIPALGAYLASRVGMLDLKFNYITLVTGSDLSEFSNLRSIDLGGNSDLYVADNAFHNQIASLEIVAMEGTGMDHFPVDLLAPLERLNYVLLGQNNISSLPDYVIDSFRCERLTMYLNQNRLGRLNNKVFMRECLDPDHVSTLPPSCNTGSPCLLSEVYLDHNQIQTADFIGDLCSLHMDNLTSISLMFNPMQCDCELYRLLYPRAIYVKGRCHEPRGMRGVTLWHQQTSGFLSFPTLMADTCNTENLTLTPSFSYSECQHPGAFTTAAATAAVHARSILLSHTVLSSITCLLILPRAR